MKRIQINQVFLCIAMMLFIGGYGTASAQTTNPAHAQEEPLKSVTLTEAFFLGAISLEPVNGGFKPWRIPYKEALLYPSPADALLARVQAPAGVRLHFTTDSRTIGLAFIASPKFQHTFDLTIDGKLIHTYTTAKYKNEKSATFTGLPAGTKVVEIWLPQQYPITITGLSIDAAASIEVAKNQRLKWVAYGSSISQCNNAHSPAQTWPAIVARQHNLALTCLGFAGECHVDPMVARLIRDTDADIITLKLGINVYLNSSLSQRTFKSAIIGMIQTIREKHPNTPIGVISPIISPRRENRPNTPHLTLVKMRAEVIDAVKRIQNTTGDKKLFYFDGLDLFSAKDAEAHLPDGLHPDGDGY